MRKHRLPLGQAVLGFLWQGPQHGYDLHEQIEEDLGEIWYVGRSNLYGTLKRLEESGRVAFDLVPQEDSPPRKVYRITPAGERQFLDWLQQPVSSMYRMRVEFLAKLFFFLRLGLEGVEDLIAEQEVVCRQRIEALEREMAECGSDDHNRLVYDFRRRQIVAVVDWLHDCRDQCRTWAREGTPAGR